MKLKQWLYGATALAMLAACSDKDIAPGGEGNSPAEEGSGYIGVRIQLPTAPSTRGNDVFGDGEATEYNLDDVALLLFRCDKAGDDDKQENAKCVGVYELRRSKDYADENKNDQITTQVVRVATVTGLAKKDNVKLYALVMANCSNNGYKLDELNSTGVNKSNKSVIGMTIKQLQETISGELLYKQPTPGNGYASYIFMTNSPLSSVAGGNNNPSTINDVMPVLVQINGKTYTTEQDAIDNPAGIIHIERAVGKVTCSEFTTSTDVKVKVGGVEYKLSVDSVYWALGQDLAETYLVRNTNRKPIDKSLDPNDYGNEPNMWLWNYYSEYATAPAGGVYRMLGHTAIPSLDIDNNAINYYRPYFCQVPGYNVGKDGSTIFEDKKFRGENISSKTKANYMEPEDAVEWNSESAFYPHENTFPVEFMKYANTTRIGFWVNFKFMNEATNTELPMTYEVTENGKKVTKHRSFYTRGIDRSTIYLENPLIGYALKNLEKNEKLKKAFTDVIKGNTEEDKEGSYKDVIDLKDFLDIKTGYKEDGQVEITSITLLNDVTKAPYNTDQYNKLFTTPPSFTFTATLLSELNNLETVYEYKGGKAFYEVRIQHFGQDLTPWDRTAHTTASTIEDSYGLDTDVSARNNNYLGRYGIVRNNWYDLQIDNITRLGPPVDPAKWDVNWPGKPDDNKDEYIAVILRVLSWAKRTQHETL